MTMKENQNPTSYDSSAFGSKEEVFEMKVRDEIGDISMDNETIDSKRIDCQNGLLDLAGVQEKGLHLLSLDTHDKDKDEKSVTGEEEGLHLLSFDTHDKDKDEKSVTVEEELKTPCIGNVYIVSNSSPCDGASDLLETVTNVFTDKNVLECELSELEVMKDICVDDGTHDGQEKLVASSVILSEKDTAEHCDLPELEQAATKHSEDDSLVDEKHLFQEAGAMVLLGSFPDSSDVEVKKTTQPTDQIEVGDNSDSLTQNCPIENAVAVDATSSSSPEVRELKDSTQTGSILFNRNIQSGRITFNLSDTEHNNNIIDISKQPSDSSGTRNHHSTKDDVPLDPKLQYDHGETSFSTITYSDPVAFSRSLSHRSDASTTSTRSFAFPVLQSEWNSSPVRMAKPDRRHFRRQRGWRSGFLCCRF